MSIEVKQKTGQWAFSKTSGKIVWENRRKTFTGYEVESEIEPEKIGYVKQIEFNVFFVKRVPSTEELDQETELYFKEKIKLTVRADCWNIYLHVSDSDRKVYVKDLGSEFGTTIQAPIETNANLLCERSKAVKVSVEEIREYWANSKNAKYLYGERREDKETGQILYRKDVSA
jgi:hypothetical protein